MEDWLVILLPLATAIYFANNPDQFRATLDWLSGLLH